MSGIDTGKRLAEFGKDLRFIVTVAARADDRRGAADEAAAFLAPFPQLGVMRRLRVQAWNKQGLGSWSLRWRRHWPGNHNSCGLGNVREHPTAEELLDVRHRWRRSRRSRGLELLVQWENHRNAVHLSKEKQAADLFLDDAQAKLDAATTEYREL